MERELLREEVTVNQFENFSVRHGVSLMRDAFAGQFANEERLTETIFSETKDYFLNE